MRGSVLGRPEHRFEDEDENAEDEDDSHMSVIVIAGNCTKAKASGPFAPLKMGGNTYWRNTVALCVTSCGQARCAVLESLSSAARNIVSRTRTRTPRTRTIRK